MIFTVNFFIKRRKWLTNLGFFQFLTNEINLKRLQSLQNGLEQTKNMVNKTLLNHLQHPDLKHAIKT